MVRSVLRLYIVCGPQSKQRVIGYVTCRRLHQLTHLGNPVSTPVLAISRMVAGQSISTTGKREGGDSEGSYADASIVKPRSGLKKSINLLRGWPSTSLLPAAALRAASQTALSDPNIWAPGLEYAPDPGYQPLREALAHWLGQFYKDVIPRPASTGIGGSEGDDRSSQEQGGNATKQKASENGDEADRITITGGASQSLACLLQSFTDPARTLAVWVVAPCYFLACPIFADAGFAGRMRAVPEDAEGVDVAFLEREMCALEEKVGEEQATRREGGGGGGGGGGGQTKYKDAGPHRKIYRHVIYCVPAFANPSGRTMTLARREGLVDVARRHDALVVCDDVYDMLQWRVEAPASSSVMAVGDDHKHDSHDFHTALLPRVVDIDMARGRSPHDPPGRWFGHAVSNGSFSKLVAPGTRTGWTYSTADFALGTSQTGSTRSGGAASQLAATIVCELLLPSRDGGDRGEEKTGKQDEGEDGAGEEECQLDTHIRQTLLPSYARRHALLTRAIRTELVPLGVRLLEGSLRGRDDVYGGYFVWMTLPASTAAATAAITTTNSTTSTTSAATATTPTPTPTPTVTKERIPWPTARAIADRCRATEALMIGNGELFAVHGDEDAVRFDDAIRLCFAWEDEEDLVDGVARLGRVIRTMLDEGPDGWKIGSEELGGVDEAK
ncbi:pyridoxal phosphate-dependent transferase [Xylaria cf. heliscus]|nr:pyridoxal phosphate-dependent transferase [Xylaria cf. heliscus]